jgi:hypothetical protein
MGDHNRLLFVFGGLVGVELLHKTARLAQQQQSSASGALLGELHFMLFGRRSARSSA